MCMSTSPSHAATVSKTNGAHHLRDELLLPYPSSCKLPATCSSCGKFQISIHPRHRLSTLLHSAGERRKTPQVSSSLCRRKMCAIRPESVRTGAEHVFTVEPSIAHVRKVISRKIRFFVLHKQHPDTGNKTARYKAGGNKRHISMCEPREQETQEIHTKATVD